MFWGQKSRPFSTFEFLAVCIILLNFTFLSNATTESEPSISSEESSEETEKRDFEDSLLLIPEGYNRHEIPYNKSAKILFTVWVSLFIRSIPTIDEQNGELVLETDFGLEWRDYKLKGTDPHTGKTIGTRILDSTVLEKVWNPDIFIDEQTTVKRTHVLTDQVQLKFISDSDLIDSDSGKIIYRARMNFRLKCEMDFTFYPADTQTCKFHVRSYTYPGKQFIVVWDGPPFLQEPDDPNFDLQVAQAGPLTGEGVRRYIVESFEKERRGNYSNVEFVVKLRRRLSYHLVQTYLPSALLILITWICFLLPGSMVEARIGICMTIVLTLTAMFASVRGQSPRVSYTMAIDIWMVFNIFLVFLALLLFSTLYCMKMRLSKKAREVEKTNLDDIQDDPLPNLVHYRFVTIFSKHYAFWAFAVGFFTFLLAYWIWLIHYSKYFDWKPNPKFNARVKGSENEFGHYKQRSTTIKYNSNRYG